jgi:hypothetical protein
LLSLLPGIFPWGRDLMRQLARVAAVISIAAWAGTAAAFSYNETVNGDLSNNRLAPTHLTASLGSNTLTATSSGSPIDREYVRITLPLGTQLDSITLTAFTSLDDVAFIAVQAGTTITVLPSISDPAPLLGYAHFGTGGLAGPAVVGTNILDDIGSGPGSITFTPPLVAGEYTWWIQQTQAQAVTYTLDFAVGVDEPSALLLALTGLVGLAAATRRRW